MSDVVTSGGLRQTLRRQVDPRQRTRPAARITSGPGHFLPPALQKDRLAGRGLSVSNCRNGSALRSYCSAYIQIGDSPLSASHEMIYAETGREAEELFDVMRCYPK